MSQSNKNDTIAHLVAELVNLENNNSVSEFKFCEKCHFQCEQTLSDASSSLVENTAKILCIVSCGFAYAYKAAPDYYDFPRSFHNALATAISRCENPSVMKVIGNDEIACCGIYAIRSYLLNGRFWANEVNLTDDSSLFIALPAILICSPF